MNDKSSLYPKISLIGAGPGDPDLITLKALKALQSADVVLYDCLVNPRLLQHCSKAELVFVGKRKDNHTFSQEAIQEMMVTYALQNLHVVRLKGGDPYVFGRGKEEESYARAFGIEVEVIPGISSAIAAPASAGIPVTFRGLAESFWVITATTREGVLSQDLIWAARSTATVVILMGLSKIHEIMEVFSEAGKGQLPVALVQEATCEGQRQVFGTVDTIEEKARERKLKAPAVIVIGDVVKLGQTIMETLPEWAEADEFVFQNLDTLPFLN